MPRPQPDASGELAAGAPPPARVRGLSDLAAVVPYLLGFVPRDSLVCVGLEGNRIGLVARTDLSELTTTVTGDQQEAAGVDQLLAALARSGAQGLVALVISSDRPGQQLIERLRASALHWQLRLLDIGWQWQDRCRSVLCDDASCCAAEGTAVDAACPAATTAAYGGTLVLPDRTDVQAEFCLPPAAQRELLEPALAEWENRAVRHMIAGHGPRHQAAQSAAVWAAARAADEAAAAGRSLPPLADVRLAQLAVALVDITVRDALWLALDSGQLHGQGLWLELARAVPPPYDAAPLFLLGWRCWRHGDGLRAGLAATAALASDAGYSAARLLLDALHAQVDPRRMPLLRADGCQVVGSEPVTNPRRWS